MSSVSPSNKIAVVGHICPDTAAAIKALLAYDEMPEMVRLEGPDVVDPATLDHAIEARPMPKEKQPSVPTQLQEWQRPGKQRMGRPR
jgi:hypothetical protein